MDASRWITRFAGWAAGVFLRVERTGGAVPPGPALIVVNHPNSLVDPLVVFRVAGRPARPLAKAPLFEQRVLGAALRGLGGLPVYRAQDDPRQMHRNDHTLDAAVAALRAGEAVQIYPEGRSHTEPSLAPLRTGAARIALAAEHGAGWDLGLSIVPVGLYYHDRSRFRGRVLAAIGEPFSIRDLESLHAEDPATAVRALTDIIAERLLAVTVNVTRHGDAALIDTAERLYVREKGSAGWRERDRLADRVPRLRAFAAGLAWLREHEPARHARLARAVSRYRRRAELLGASEGDVPPRYTFTGTLRYMIVEGVWLLFALPIALAGSVVWYPTWAAPRLTLRFVRPDEDAVATYKLATGLAMVPVTMVAGMIAAGLIFGAAGTAAAALLLPASAFIALAWHERRRRAAEDARLFFRVLLRRDRSDRLARDRRRLVAEFDAIAAAGAIPAAGRPDASTTPG
jgi:glycerol-3-phosphate O-acyltransferase / dihydroxyacetone phosphate acyltransferase